MGHKPLEVADVKRVAQGRWESILSALASGLGPALQRVGKHVDCPFPGHGGKNDFRLYKDVAETGGAICSCGTWSDGFALLMHANCWTFPETVKAVGEYVGLGNDEPSQPTYRNKEAEKRRDEQLQRQKERQRKEQEAKDVQRSKSLNSKWADGRDLSDPDAEPVRLYLARRGLLTKNLPKSLRYYKDLPYYHEGENIGSWPALLALTVSLQGEPITLHRTYITDEGHKAPVPEGKVKKLMSAPSTKKITGGAIRLAEPKKVLGVAEGLETGLSISQFSDIPMWVTISAKIMEKLDIPECVDTVVIFADKDANNTGQKSAQALARRVKDMNKEALIVVPPMSIPAGSKSVDWNDYLIQFGPKNIPNVAYIHKQVYGKKPFDPSKFRKKP